MNRRVEPNVLVCGSINYNGKSYYHQGYGEAWRQIRSNIESKLVGNKFIKKNYSLYSLSSTIIENKLLEGIDLFLLSRICGHDLKVLLRHYERLDIRKRPEELTLIPIGTKKK